MPAPITPGTPVTPAAQKPNGAPAPAAAAQPDLAAQLAAAQKERDEYKTKYEGIDKKLRVNTIEMRKFSDEKSGLGAKLSAHDKMSKALAAAGVDADDLAYFKANPERVLKKALGDGWYERIVDSRINGGAVTAETVAAEIERAKNDVRAELEGKQKAEADERTKQQQAAAETARAELGKDATAFLEKSWAEYPVFEDYERPQIAAAIVRFQESEYHRTGKVLSPKEAADALENAEVSRAEKVASKPKYGAKLTEKLKPANTSPVVGSRSAGERSPERRTLSNDLTATTPQAKRAHRTDEERMAAIKALDLSK